MKSLLVLNILEKIIKMKHIKKLTLVLILLLMILLPVSIFADIDPDNIKINLGTPREAIFYHYKYLLNDSYSPEISVKALNIDKRDEGTGEDLAIKLKKILDGKAIMINFTKLSNDSNYIDSSSGKNIYLPFKGLPDVYLEKTGNKWKYSRHTIELIPKIYKEIYPFQLSEFLESLPDSFQKVHFGLKTWQLVGLLFIIVSGYILKMILSIILRLISSQILCRTRFRNSVETYIKPNIKIINSLIVIIVIYEVLPVLELPVKLFFYLNTFLAGLIPVMMTLIIFRLTDYLVEKVQNITSKKTTKKYHDNLLPFLKTTFKVFLILVGLLAVFISIGVDVFTLLAGLSIGGIAIALAAQETIKNIFGSLTVFSDRPFDVGDWIIFQGGEGTVETIGVRSTRIRTIGNSLITVPNGKLSDMTIDNLGRRQYRRFLLNLDIERNTPIEKIEAFTEGLNKIIIDSEDTRKDIYYVNLNNITSNSYQIMFQIFFAVENYELELKARQKIITQIITIAQNLEIKFAYPVQKIMLEQ